MGSVSARYQLLPDLSESDFIRLRADIVERGIMVPIEVDEDGAILDGHHRQRIATELGLTCPRVVRCGLPEHEKRLHAVALNAARRQLTDAQKTFVGMQIEPDVQERARLRQAHGLTAPGRSGSVDPQRSADRARDEVAAAVGLGSGSTYERSKRVLAQAPADVVVRAQQGDLDVRGVRQEVLKVHKETRVAEIAAAPAAVLPTEQTYPVLLCDPPWRYEGAESDSRKIENHYPTMSHQDLLDLKPPAGNDAVLFLWATSPKLTEALALLEAWDFDYRTCLVWVKDRIGMGYYARQQHELLLVARRGELPVPDPQNRPSSVIQAPRGVHSAKPDQVYELIETMYPRFARCELFARAARTGWVGWGNQAVTP